MTFGRRVKSLLEDKKMNQKELARLVGLTPQMVSTLLSSAKRPAPKHVSAIAAALDIDPKVLDAGDSLPPEIPFMSGLDVEYLRAAMRALVRARENLLGTRLDMALRPAAGKEDTIWFDRLVEETIIQELDRFDKDSAIFTEERVCEESRRKLAGKLCYFIDPFDRSRHFARELSGKKRVGEARLIQDVTAAEDFGMRGVCAPTGSITMVREGRVVFNAMMDYATGEFYVACAAMLQHGPSTDCGTPEALLAYGNEIPFDGPSDNEHCVCYMGPDSDMTEEGDAASPKARVYKEAFAALGLGEHQIPLRGQREPGGPARLLYLSSLNDDPNPPSFVLSNGEKIGEWLGWLAYAIYGVGFVAFELSASNNAFRDGFLLAPPENYSIFRLPRGGEYRRRGDPDWEAPISIDFARLAMFNNPSFYRGAIAITRSRAKVGVQLSGQPNARKLHPNPPEP
jgi:transcriptional regulator with XRE-family HTH domain